MNLNIAKSMASPAPEQEKATRALQQESSDSLTTRSGKKLQGQTFADVNKEVSDAGARTKRSDTPVLDQTSPSRAVQSGTPSPALHLQSFLGKAMPAVTGHEAHTQENILTLDPALSTKETAMTVMAASTRSMETVIELDQKALETEIAVMLRNQGPQTDEAAVHKTQQALMNQNATHWHASLVDTVGTEESQTHANLSLAPQDQAARRTQGAADRDESALARPAKENQFLAASVTTVETNADARPAEVALPQSTTFQKNTPPMTERIVPDSGPAQTEPSNQISDQPVRPLQQERSPVDGSNITLRTDTDIVQQSITPLSVKPQTQEGTAQPVRRDGETVDALDGKQNLKNTATQQDNAVSPTGPPRAQNGDAAVLTPDNKATQHPIQNSESPKQAESVQTTSRIDLNAAKDMASANEKLVQNFEANKQPNPAQAPNRTNASAAQNTVSSNPDAFKTSEKLSDTSITPAHNNTKPLSPTNVESQDTALNSTPAPNTASTSTNAQANAVIANTTKTIDRLGEVKTKIDAPNKESDSITTSKNNGAPTFTVTPSTAPVGEKPMAQISDRLAADLSVPDTPTRADRQSRSEPAQPTAQTVTSNAPPQAPAMAPQTGSAAVSMATPPTQTEAAPAPQDAIDYIEGLDDYTLAKTDTRDNSIDRAVSTSASTPIQSQAQTLTEARALPYTLTQQPLAAPLEQSTEISPDSLTLDLEGLSPLSEARSEARLENRLTQAQITAAIPRPTTIGGGDAIEQVVQAAVSAKGAARLELRLDPPDLGRVEIDFDFSEDKLTVVVRAEREEALDLMRRHADELLKSFKSSGLDLGSLDFAKDGSDQHDNKENKNFALKGNNAGEDEGLSSAPIQTIGGQGRLDIRI